MRALAITAALILMALVLAFMCAVGCAWPEWDQAEVIE